MNEMSFAGASEWEKPGAWTTRGASQLRRHVPRHEVLKRLAPLRRHQVGSEHLPAIQCHMERRVLVREAGLEPGEAFVPHQHQKLDLGKVLRCCRVKVVLAVLDGEGPVIWEGAARRQPDLGQRLRREALDRVAVEADDPCAISHGAVPPASRFWRVSAANCLEIAPCVTIRQHQYLPKANASKGVGRVAEALKTVRHGRLSKSVLERKTDGS